MKKYGEKKGKKGENTNKGKRMRKKIKYSLDLSCPNVFAMGSNCGRYASDHGHDIEVDNVCYRWHGSSNWKKPLNIEVVIIHVVIAM